MKTIGKMTPEEIKRVFTRFRSVIPATSGDERLRRTAYFFRKQAIAWARRARQWRAVGEMEATFRSLAKLYLSDYNKMKKGTKSQ